jgi:hypothetical protein
MNFPSLSLDLTVTIIPKSPPVLYASVTSPHNIDFKGVFKEAKMSVPV